MPVLDPAPRHDLTAAKSSKNRHQYGECATLATPQYRLSGTP
ncbi:hypothetical protein ARSEF1564_001971 [Beauveria bassiana]